jgi:uncharacterized membrane protein
VLVLTSLVSVFSDIFVKREKLYDALNLFVLISLILSLLLD